MQNRLLPLIAAAVALTAAGCKKDAATEEAAPCPSAAAALTDDATAPVTTACPEGTISGVVQSDTEGSTVESSSGGAIIKPIVVVTESDSGTASSDSGTASSDSGTASDTSPAVDHAPVLEATGALTQTVTFHGATSPITLAASDVDGDTAVLAVEYGSGCDALGLTGNLDQGAKTYMVTAGAAAGACTIRLTAVANDASSNIISLVLTVTAPIDDIAFVPDNKLRRRVYTSDEYAAATATVNFSHNGDSAQCSSDGGTTYAACTTLTSFSWHLSNKANVHKVKITKAGAANSPYVYSFTPATNFPDIQVVTCTANVTANEDFDAFNARLGGNHVICIDNNVTISNDDTVNQAAIRPGTGDVIIARQGAHVTFSSSDSMHHAFEYWFNGDNSKLVGITVDYTGAAFSRAAAQITWVGGVFLNDCVFHSNGKAALDLQSSQTGDFKLIGIDASTTGSNQAEAIQASTVTMTGELLTLSSVDSSALSIGNGGSISISDSVLTSGGSHTVYFSSSGSGPTSLSLNHARLIDNYNVASSRAIFLDFTANQPNTVTVTDSEIFTMANGILVVGSQAASSVTLAGTTIAHVNSGQSNSYGVYVSGTSGKANMLIAGNNHNRVCNQVLGGAGFNRYVDVSMGDAQTSFVAANQDDAGVIGLCPAGLAFP